MIFHFSKHNQKGIIEIALLTSLIGVHHQTCLLTILCIAIEIIMVSTVRQKEISITTGLVFLFFGLQKQGLLFLIYFLLSTCFPKNNFFQIILFSFVLVCGLYSTNIGSISNFLIKCVCLQLIIISIINILKLSKQYIFYILLGFNLLAVIYSFYQDLHLQLVQNHNLLRVVFEGSLALIITVIASLAISYFSLPKVYIRKTFHIPPLILFPLFSTKFPDIFQTAVIGVLYIFIILELLRYFSSKNQQEGFLFETLRGIWRYMNSFLDARDKYLWVTHLSLLIGISTSYFMNSDKTVQSSSVIIPVGDAFAAIIGTKYGMTKIGKKSLQGTIAFILSTFLTFYVFGFIFESGLDYYKLLVSIFLTALMQLFSKQIDNLLLPLFFSYVYFCL